MRLDSPIPPYMLRDPITGPRVESQEKAIQEFMQQDRALAEAFIAELAETRGLHGAIATRGWSGLPVDAVVMPQETCDDLVTNRKKGAAAQLKLTWGDMCRAPGFSSGHLSQVEALEQAVANYDAYEAAH